MEQALLEEAVLEREEAWAWEEGVAEVEWEVAKQVQGPKAFVYVLPVELLLPIKWDYPVIK
jgi:hypothetical protein